MTVFAADAHEHAAGRPCPGYRADSVMIFPPTATEGSGPS